MLRRHGIVLLRARAQPRQPAAAAPRGERLHPRRVVVVAHVVAAQRRAQRVSQFPLQRAGGTTSCRAAGGTRPRWRCSAAPAPPDRPDASGTPARRAGWIRRRPSPRARTRSSRAAPGRGAGCASPGRGTRPPPGCSGTGGRRARSGARPGSPPCSPAAARTPPGPRSRQCPWALPWPPARRRTRRPAASITRRTPCCGASHPVFTSKPESVVTMRMATAPPSSGDATWISRRWRYGSQYCPSTSALSSSKNTPVSVTTKRPPRSAKPKRARATAARSASTQNVPATSRCGPRPPASPAAGARSRAPAW